MAKAIEVTFYKKTHSLCPQCDSMMDALVDWIEKNQDVEVTLITLSAEENIKEITRMYPKAMAAPVVIVKRGRSINMVCGNNPDVLVDYLTGLDSIWD